MMDRMLSYFPAVYPGELLYSVLGRYHRHVGLPGPMCTLESLFGNRKVIAAFDLQGHLQALADRIPPERKLTAELMIDMLTLCPYFTGFEPPSLQVNVRQAMMCGVVENLHIRLGLTAFRVERINRLRFCLECTRDMIANHGELYWRRDHQLPSVLVCPEHGCSLLESTVSFSQFSRHEFIAATPENCPRYARPVVLMMDELQMRHLHRLACLSSDLLDTQPKPRTFGGWTAFYRSQMLETGLTRSAYTMDQQRLDQEFRKFYGRTLELLPHVMDGSKFTGDWLAAMVRKHRKANHPLYHLLMQDFLAQRNRHISPFGTGPWSCLNPLVRHYLKDSIKRIKQHSNHGKTVGVFACACGYTYTRFYDAANDKLGLPRFLHYGPLLEPALNKLIADGASLRKTGRALQLDPKTVVRLARELSIAIPWKLKISGSGGAASKGLIGHLVEKPQRNNQSVSVCSHNKSDLTRYDWNEIDHEWLAKLSALAAIIRKESPPVRITVAELERRAGLRGWLLKRRHRLPQTISFLGRMVESVEDFQIRRIYWAIGELEHEGGLVKAWQVMRKAGLRSAFLERINVALEAVPSSWSVAA
jgi:hypothetical protein